MILISYDICIISIFYEKVTELLLINISNVMDKLISNASGW